MSTDGCRKCDETKHRLDLLDNELTTLTINFQNAIQKLQQLSMEVKELVNQWPM